MTAGLDFLIVGTMKSGTSSLAFHLRQNPRVAMPGPEAHFFDRDEAFAKGRAWYLGQLAKNAGPQTRVVGEKTPTYSYVPEVAGRIHAMFPEVKLIWTLRHPVDRAYSNYLHAVCNGMEAWSFEQAIAAEPERIEKNIFHGYLTRSRYLEQVQRFARLFPLQRMAFVLFEDIVKDTAGALSQVCEFLEVEPEARLVHEPRGATQLPRWPASLVRARDVFGRGPVLQVLKKLNTWGVAPGYPKLDPERRAELYAPFRDDMRRLGDMIGLDLSRWEA